MKILLVHNSYQHRGGEDVVFEQERELLERGGHRVVVFRRSNEEIRAFTPLKRLALPCNTVWSSGVRDEFSSVLKREAPEIVHVHNTFVVISPSIYSACRENGIPVVQTLHNFRWMCPGALFYRDGRICEDCATDGLWNGICHGCYRGSKAATATIAITLAIHRHLRTWHNSIDLYITPTAFAREKFVAAGFPAAKIVVKPHFVDPEPVPGDGSGGYALYAGRLSAEKGLETLLEAWALLPAPIPLQIIGDGPERDGLEGLVRERRLSSVSFRGRLSKEAVLAAMRGARLAIVPSTAYETFGLVIVEAMSCGTPVLCSRLGAMQELVADRLTGLHFNPGDAQDLSQKITWAWDHPSELTAMRLAARRVYEKRYTARVNYAQLVQLYSRVIADRSPGLPHGQPSGFHSKLCISSQSQEQTP